jgi:hypothetical protein
MIDQPDLFSVPVVTRAQHDLIHPRKGAPGLVRNDHPETSRAAAYAVTPRTGTQRRRVLDAIAAKPSTDEEIQSALHMNPNTQRPRRVELVRGGWVGDSGERRPSSTGQDSIVWGLARPFPA